MVFACVLVCSPLAARVIYVDRDARNGARNGSSWADAYLTVAAGVAAALEGDELWVAEGIYMERIALDEKIALYGGFAGTEAARSQRNWQTHPTTLDVLGGTGFTLNEPCRIDGFRVIRGVNGLQGGGIVCQAGGRESGTTSTIANCVLDGNTGGWGGGLNCYNDRVEVVACRITNNVGTEGGGIYAFDTMLAVKECVISGNFSPVDGGGILARASGAVRGPVSCWVSASTFTLNRANNLGGGIYVATEAAVNAVFLVDRCVITGNQSTNGAGVELGGIGEVRDSLIANNLAGFMGGAVEGRRASMTLRNCTIARNQAAQFGALSSWESRLSAYNCILYENGAAPIGGMMVVIDYCCYDGGFPAGPGTILGNPGFVAPDAGDFRVGPSSICIDAGYHGELAAGQTRDLDGRARIADGNRDGVAQLDMGAYEMVFWRDLVIRDFDFAPHTIRSGERVFFAGRVVNDGNLATTGTFWIEFLASPRPDFSSPLYYLCRSYNVTANLAPRQAVSLGGLLRTLDPPPSGPPGGLYYVGIRVDPLDEIDEANETNNFSWVPSQRLGVEPCPTEATPNWMLYR